VLDSFQDMTKNKKFWSKSEKIYIQKSRYSLKGPLKVALVLLARGDSSFDVAIQFDRRNLEENDPSETARTKRKILSFWNTKVTWKNTFLWDPSF